MQACAQAAFRPSYPAQMFQAKVSLASFVNWNRILNRHKFQLSAGLHPNKELQKDWNQYGQEKFTLEILETIEEKDDHSFNMKEEFELLEQVWLEKLQPSAENSYNIDTNLRQA